MCTTVAAQVLECASMRFDGMSENGHIELFEKVFSLMTERK